MLTGQLVPAAQEAGGTADGARHPVTTSPLLDWVVDYGAAEPALWAVTQHAWYRLLQPSARYAQLFAGVQRKAALAHAAAADGSAAANPEGAVERAAAAMQASGDQAAKEFALAQVQASAGTGAACTQFLKKNMLIELLPAGRHTLVPIASPFTGLQAKLGLRPRAGGKRAADGPRSRPAKKQRVGGRVVLQPGWECSHAHVRFARLLCSGMLPVFHDLQASGAGKGVRFAGGAGSVAGSVNDFGALAGGPYIYGELEPESDGDVPDDFHPSGGQRRIPGNTGVELAAVAHECHVSRPSRCLWCWIWLHLLTGNVCCCPADAEAEAEGGASRARRLAWLRTRRRKEEERLRAGEQGRGSAGKWRQQRHPPDGPSAEGGALATNTRAAV